MSNCHREVQTASSSRKEPQKLKQTEVETIEDFVHVPALDSILMGCRDHQAAFITMEKNTRMLSTALLKCVEDRI